MHFATLLATASILASSTFAAPAPEPWHGREYSDDCYCLSDSDAQQAADIFQELIQNYSDELALASLSKDFTDYSSSVAIIINGGDNDPLDITTPVFTGRHNFMAGQGSQPEIPFQQLAIFHGCDSVSMRWLTKRSAKGQETEAARIPVVGNVIMETVKSEPGDKYNFRIKTIYSEFNSAAWMVNLGIFTPPPDAGDDDALGVDNGNNTKRSLPTLRHDHRGNMI